MSDTASDATNAANADTSVARNHVQALCSSIRGGGAAKPDEFVQDQIAKIDGTAATALRQTKHAGLRRFGSGTQLTVRIGKVWMDAEVTSASGTAPHSHRLRILSPRAELQEEEVLLHPWNHAPLELPEATFALVYHEYIRQLRVQHSAIQDALTGRKLNVKTECVKIGITIDSDQGEAVLDGASYLANQLHELYEKRLAGDALVDSPAAVLLTGQAASGKSSLLSQVIMHTLDRTDGSTRVFEVEEQQAPSPGGAPTLLPILIRVQQLQWVMQENKKAFEKSNNWIETFLYLTNYKGKASIALYRMLRQALAARRALLLFDGLDEAGDDRLKIERHLMSVLALQGHTILITSRPEGYTQELFANKSYLSPLTEEQQEEAFQKRLGNVDKVRMQSMLDYLGKVPKDEKSGDKITANPLMLSMVASIFELREGADAPKTVVELYEQATRAMFSYGGASSSGSSGSLARFLQAVFFRAHNLGVRIIDEQILKDTTEEFAVGAEHALSVLRSRLLEDRVPLVRLVEKEPLQVQAAHLSFQEFFTAKAISEHSIKPVRLHTPPWEFTLWWANVMRLGLEMGATLGLKWDKHGAERPTVGRELHIKELADALQKDTEFPPGKMGELGVVDLRVADFIKSGDDYFTVHGNPSFREELLGQVLANPRWGGLSESLYPSIKGHPPTATLALAAVLREAPHVKELSVIYIEPWVPTELEAIRRRIPRFTVRLDRLREKREAARVDEDPEWGDKKKLNFSKSILSRARITDIEMQAIAAFLSTRDVQGNLSLTSVKELWISCNAVGDDGIAALGEACAKGALPLLIKLGLGTNRIGDDGLKALGQACEGGRALPKLTHLFLDKNRVGDKGVIALSYSLRKNGALPRLERVVLSGPNAKEAAVMKFGLFGDAALEALAKAMSCGAAPRLTNIDLTGTHKAGEKAKAAVEAALKNRWLQESFLALHIGSCTSLDMSDLSWGDVEAAQLARALRACHASPRGLAWAKAERSSGKLSGRPLESEPLVTALKKRGSLEFGLEEWRALGVDEVGPDDYVDPGKSHKTYFKPLPPPLTLLKNLTMRGNAFKDEAAVRDLATALGALPSLTYLGLGSSISVGAAQPFVQALASARKAAHTDSKGLTVHLSTDSQSIKTSLEAACKECAVTLKYNDRADAGKHHKSWRGE